MVTQRFKNAANDAVTSRVNLDTGLLAVGGGDVAHCIGVDGTVVEFNTVGDVLHVFLADGLVGPHLIDFLLYILRMGELGCEVSVIGEQKHTGGVAVKTSHRIDALFTGSLHEVHDGFTAVGVIAGGDTVLGLVEQDVALLFSGHDFAIVLHDILGRNLHTQFSHNSIIDHDETLLDVFIGHAARADAGVSQELVQTNLHVGIDSGLLVEYALGLGCEAHLGLGTLALGTLLIAALTLLVAALALLVTALALLVTTLALLVAALALLVTTLALLVTTLTGLVATLALLVTSLTLLVTSLTLVTTLTGLVTALTGLIATLTGLVASLLLFRIHGSALGIGILFT